MPLWKRRIFESRPVTRVEISPGFGRWVFTYVGPLLSSILIGLIVILALSDWLPHILGIGVTNPEHLRLIGAVVFVVTYVLHVRALKREFRAHDSEFIE